jgi:periplasmic copper chaperone A
MNKVNFLLLTTLFLQLLFSSSAFTNENAGIEISDAWISEAPPTMTILAGYVNIHNRSGDAMTLLTVSSPDFSKIEIHRSVIKDEMVSMEKQVSLEIPARETVKLSPGDFHLMLFDPEKPLRSGDTATLSFSFANGDTQTIEAKVKRRSSDEHEHHHH